MGYNKMQSEYEFFDKRLKSQFISKIGYLGAKLLNYSNRYSETRRLDENYKKIEDTLKELVELVMRHQNSRADLAKTTMKNNQETISRLEKITKSSNS